MSVAFFRESHLLPLKFDYSVCGLRLRSDRFIPDLIPAENCKADVEISFHEHPQSRQFGLPTVQYTSRDLTPSGLPIVTLSAIVFPSDLYMLLYADGTQFVIDTEGSKVWATWANGSSFEDTLTYLLGPVLGFILRLRDVPCLHASSIAVNGAAIALAGPGGSGKSTLAAQFASLGFSVLADDIVTLAENGRAFLVHPSPARLRLWPSSVEGLFGSPDALPRLTPSWEKLYLDLRSEDRRLQRSPLPLAAIYLLNNIEQPAGKIADLLPSSAMVHLLGNIYVNYLLDAKFRGRDFNQIAKLLRTVPVRQLNLQHDFSVLERTCCSILGDFEMLGRNHHPFSPALDICGPATCVG